MSRVCYSPFSGAGLRLRSWGTVVGWGWLWVWFSACPKPNVKGHATGTEQQEQRPMVHASLLDCEASLAPRLAARSQPGITRLNTQYRRFGHLSDTKPKTFKLPLKQPV